MYLDKGVDAVGVFRIQEFLLFWLEVGSGTRIACR
jgi:hypothetical protein